MVRDVVDVAGSPAAVYEFLYSAGKWPDRLPHVASVDVRHDADDTQLIEVVTEESRGGTLTTRLARVGFPHTIAHKHLLLPPLGSSHHVTWHITAGPTGTTVDSRQVAVIDEAGAREVLGADLGRVRDFVTQELSTKVCLLLTAAGS